MTRSRPSCFCSSRYIGTVNCPGHERAGRDRQLRVVEVHVRVARALRRDFTSSSSSLSSPSSPAPPGSALPRRRRTCRPGTSRRSDRRRASRSPGPPRRTARCRPAAGSRGARRWSCRTRSACCPRCRRRSRSGCRVLDADRDQLRHVARADPDREPPLVDRLGFTLPMRMHEHLHAVLVGVEAAERLAEDLGHAVAAVGLRIDAVVDGLVAPVEADRVVAGGEEDALHAVAAAPPRTRCRSR